MRTLIVLATVLTLGRVASADVTLEGHVTDLLGKPLAGIPVEVEVGGQPVQALTDKAGNYTVSVAPDQDVSIVIASSPRKIPRAALKDGAHVRFDFQIEAADGEIIRVIDTKPPTVPPKVPEGTPRKTPPYSSQAILRNAWARAWLLLDVDADGKVLRVKLVKRPGFDLDEIAVKEAMKLHFDPALDENGKPMRTLLLWSMEWPSHSWLTEGDNLALRLPDESHFTGYGPTGPIPTNSGGRPRNFGAGAGRSLGPVPGPFMGFTDKTLSGVPCAGSGPLLLDRLDYGLDVVYRDCSKPNKAKIPYLPWLDGTQPIPPEPPQFAPVPEAPVVLTKASYIPQIVASTVTATLVATWVVTFVEYNKYSQRVADASKVNTDHSFDYAQYDSDVSKFKLWQKLTIGTAVAAIASGFFTTSLWLRHQRSSEFSVQPEGDGASAVFTKHF